MDDSLAQSLGMHAVGTYEAHGAGGSQAGTQVAGAPIRIPGLTVRQRRVDTTTLRALSAMSGRSMDVILGYELFRDCMVRFDYAAGVMDVWDRHHAPRESLGVAVPMTLESHLPYVEGEIDFPGRAPISGRFVIDTGSGGSLAIMPEIVERDSLATSLPRTLETISRGVGGEIHSRAGRANAFRLGTLTFEKPIAVLAPAITGRMAARGAVGNIGGQVLGRCSVTFDYRHQRVFFEPNPKFSDPFEADMSGAVLLRTGADYVVRLVNPDSPASEAGLEEGDHVTSIDGTPTAGLDLSALRTHLTGAGRSVRLEVTRGDEHHTATMVLRRLI